MGLPMALVDVDQALNGDWRVYEQEVDVVRVQDPPVETWPQLREAGFLPKPQVLLWRAQTRATEEEFLAGLPRKDRYDIRVAYRNATASGLHITTEPLTVATLTEFLGLYEQQISQMRNGWAVAVEQREQILSEADTYCVVRVRAQDEVVGVCLNQDLPATDEIRARFSAVSSNQRSDSLARVLYWEALREARRRRRRWVSLGRDINLYGHVVKSGLFSFKSRLGFTAVPSQRAEPGSGSHQADRVVRFSELSDPALLLSYSPARDENEAVASPLWLNVFTADPALGVQPFRGVDLAGTTVHEIKPV
ncbi:GNAT family N-acetyltransferase [Streptomyces sp. NBC_00154]|uniref:GNAT family N-acetyltransferase n=1 Tax=Streptomyces sp. NBC_00154 TaxID=2975670 RepID=UPI00224D8F25|nr:GNAT family N-acetyltransferase [Streptomyces sp. NBC_00154]MCX5316118.1 GNAT family N-acetyltransferase [Streptomyces sp. NBC_00154]